jgi:hypothetical protein
VIVSALLLVPAYQAKGAAAAAVIGEVVLCASLYVSIRGAGPGQWLPVSATLRIALAAAPAVGIGLIPGLPTAVRAVAVAVVFAGGALLFGALPSEMLDVGRRLAARLRLTRAGGGAQ